MPAKNLNVLHDQYGKDKPRRSLRMTVAGDPYTWRGKQFLSSVMIWN